MSGNFSLILKCFTLSLWYTRQKPQDKITLHYLYNIYQYILTLSIKVFYHHHQNVIMLSDNDSANNTTYATTGKDDADDEA